MYKGIVMKVGKKTSSALCEGKYYKVANKKDMKVGMQIMFTKEDVVDEPKKGIKGNHIYRSIGVAALIAIMVLTSAVYYSNNSAVYALVTMDINPSVEISLNKDYKVIKVEAVNEDGKKIEDAKVKGLSIEAAIEVLIEESKGKGFIVENEETYVIVTAVPVKGTENNEEFNIIKARIQAETIESATLQSVNIGVLESTQEEHDKAEEADVPLGLYVFNEKEGSKDFESIKEFFKEEGNLELFEELGDFIENYHGELDDDEEDDMDEDEDDDLDEDDEDEVDSVTSASKVTEGGIETDEGQDDMDEDEDEDDELDEDDDMDEVDSVTSASKVTEGGIETDEDDDSYDDDDSDEDDDDEDDDEEDDDEEDDDDDDEEDDD